jgi:hypothetical protein
MKHDYLACYAYGSGGIWLIVQARSRDEVAAHYPQLTVVDQPPGWLSPAKQVWLAAHHTVDIDAPPAWLRTLLTERTRA